MEEYFKYIVDNADNPVVIVDLNYTIIYMNKAADKSYSRGREMLGKHIELFMSEETLSKIVMTMEWFKEDVNNNKIFAFHDENENGDIYMLAVRNSEGELIGACSHMDSRTIENTPPFNID